jgi:hypothetical protein
MAKSPDRQMMSRPRWRVTAKRLALVLGVLIAVGAALPLGCVGNRMFNASPEDFLRAFETSNGLPYAVAVVEFDDQGEPWDLRQLEATLELINDFNRRSAHGVVLYQFIHGWKSNASRDSASGMRLAWFEDRIKTIAEYSAEESENDPRAGRPVVGLYIGWRGRTYSLPILIDASFWNRRVAAHRVASMRLVEVLYRSARAANSNPDSKCILVGHSMGGLVLEKTIGPALVSAFMAVKGEGETLPLDYDLIISANASIEALYSKQLIDILKRSRIRLVLRDPDGQLRAARGPLLVSVTSENDRVTRVVFPFAMTINSLFVRYRGYPDPAAPSQRRLGLHSAGWVPSLHSHRVTLEGDRPAFHDIQGRWNDTPFWVFQVPGEISGGHNDIDGPVWGRMMLELMELNDVFDPDVELRLTQTADDIP